MANIVCDTRGCCGFDSKRRPRTRGAIASALGGVSRRAGSVRDRGHPTSIAVDNRYSLGIYASSAEPPQESSPRNMYKISSSIVFIRLGDREALALRVNALVHPRDRLALDVRAVAAELSGRRPSRRRRRRGGRAQSSLVVSRARPADACELVTDARFFA